MTDVPSNLIPTRITQLPLAPVADENSLMMIVYQGNNYQIRVGDLLSVAGVPTTRQVIAGTGMAGGGQLSSNVTLSIAPGGVGSTQLANSGVTPGTYGNSTNIPVFTVDNTGRVMAATTVPATISGYVPDTRQVIAGSGLTGGGALTSNVTLAANLSNATPLAVFQSGSAGSSTEIARADHKHPAVDLSADDEVDGLLGLGNGGTGRSISASPGAVVWCGADGLYVTAVGAPGQVLVSNGTAAPSWGSALIISDQPANVVYAGPSSGPAGPTSFRSLVTDDLPASGVAAATYGAAATVPVFTVNAKGQITAVTNTAIAISASQVTSGTLDVARGGTGISTTPTNGQIDIGNGSGFTRANLTPSSGISITNGAGSVTIANSGVLSLSGGTTGLTPSSPTTGAVTLGGTLTVANGGTGATTLTGYVKGNGTSAFTANPTIPNGDLQNSSVTIGSTSVALGATATTISGLTTLTLTQNPVNPLEAATKQYVDAAVEGLNVHAPAVAATTANLNATYANGSSGVGATLTNAGAQAAFAVDGYTAALNDRILVKNQTTAAQNGVYTVTTLGSGSTNWVLTRATDMNSAGNGADQIGPGDYVFVSNGTLNAGTAWVITTPLPITIGSTSITFVQFAGPGTYTAGAGLTLTGTQFSVTDTSVTPATYGSASSVPTIAVNSRGQITSASDTSISISATQVTSGNLDSARLSGSYTGITGVGTLTAGTWNATTLGVAYGGTGRTAGNYSVYSREIHVSSADGDDTTGDGTLINPVQTITKALTLQTATRLTVLVHPGVYTESPTVTTTNTTIATSELTGANTQLNGTLTLSAAARVSGLKMNNLTITGTGNTYISNCTVDTRLQKTGSNYVEIINTELQCTLGVQISGAGVVSIVGNKCWAVTVSNASANVLIKDCYQVLTPSVTAGTLQIDGSAIFAASAASNAVTSSAGSFITLANSFILNSAGTNVERVSLAGSFSILNLVYDKTNSTFAGTNLNAIDYFSVINADTVVAAAYTGINGGTF